MRNGWRLTCVYSDGTEYGFTVAAQCGTFYDLPYNMTFVGMYVPLMEHNEIMRRIDEIEAEAKAHPEQWPGFLGCGMEFRSDTE